MTQGYEIVEPSYEVVIFGVAGGEGSLRTTRAAKVFFASLSRTEQRLRLCRCPAGCLPVDGNSHESFSSYFPIRTGAKEASRCAALEKFYEGT